MNFWNGRGGVNFEFSGTRNDLKVGRRRGDRKGGGFDDFPLDLGAQPGFGRETVGKGEAAIFAAFESLWSEALEGVGLFAASIFALEELHALKIDFGMIAP